MGTIPAFASANQALDMVRAGLRFLVSADATQLTAAERAACLRGLEHPPGPGGRDHVTA